MKRWLIAASTPVLMVAGALATGCSSDSPDTPDDPVDVSEDTGGGTGTVDVDTYTPPDPPAACELVRPPGTPSWYGPSPTLVFGVSHPDAIPFANVRAIITPGDCSVAADAGAECTAIPAVADQGDGTFAIENWDPGSLPASCYPTPNGLDLVDAHTGDYCLSMSAELNPENPDPSWGTLGCTNQAGFRIDADGPAFLPPTQPEGEPPVEMAPVNWQAPSQAGTYYEVMPVRALIGARTDVTSAEVWRDDDLLAELTMTPSKKWGPGWYDVDDEIDICGLGTGTEDIRIVLTDALDNVREFPFEIRAVRCPRFQSTERVESGDDAKANYFTLADVDGNAENGKEIVAATSGGVVYYTHDGGTLHEPRLISGLSAPARFVIPDDFNGDGRPDFAVVESGGDNDRLSIYLWACRTDLSPLAELSDLEIQAWKQDNGGCPVCEDTYVEVESHVIPAEVTALLYGDMAAGEGNASSDNLRDIILGTNNDTTAVGLFLRRQDNTCLYDEAPLDDLCRPIGVPTEGRCFDLRTWVDASAEAGGGGVIAIERGNFVTDDQSPPLQDLAVGFGGGSFVGIIEHEGNGSLRKPTKCVGLPAPVSQIVRHNVGDEIGKDNVADDLLVVMPDAQQVWQLYGTGRTPWCHLTSGAPPQLDHRATCIEGGPAMIATALLGGPTDTELDLVVANRDAGTLWSMEGKYNIGAGQNLLPGWVYRAFSIVDALPEPKQMVLDDMNGDGYPDAILLNTEGEMAIVQAANPTLPVGDEGYGVQGTFLGGRNITTPIPQQETDFACDSTAAAATEGTSLGLPLDRLEPRRMSLADFDADGHMDVALLAERAEFVGGAFREEQVLAHPVLFYSARPNTTTGAVAPYYPTTNIAKKDVVSSTRLCYEGGTLGGVSEPNPCLWAAEQAKGTTSAMIAAKMDFGSYPDLAITNNTFYSTVPPSGPNPPPQVTYPTIDLLWGYNNWVFQQEGMPEQGETPNGVYTVGLTPGSRAVSVAPTYCSNASSQIPALAVVTELNTAAFNAVQLKVMRTSGNQEYSWQNDAYVFTLQEGVTGLEVQSATLGDANNATDWPDLLLATSEGIQIYRGLADADCIFHDVGIADVGTGYRGMTTKDLDKDGFAELIVTRGDGTVAIAPGLDGASFEPASYALQTNSSGLRAPTVADINGDGIWDILALDANAARVHVFLGLGGREFLLEPDSISVAPFTDQLVVHDFSGDNCPEVLTLSRAAKALGLLPNLGPQTVGGVKAACVLPQ